MVLNAILNAGILGATVGSIVNDVTKGKQDFSKQLTVSMITGVGGNSGGSVPHVAIWDEHGNRISQYKGDENGHVDEGSTKTVYLDPYQNDGKIARPDYLLIVMQETDAVCLSAIMATGANAQYTWTGDYGYTCGAQWYNSKEGIAGSNKPVKCVWLDSDHTNGIVAKGLSLHMPDFAPDAGIIEQYNMDQARLCQNTARMTFQPEPVVPDSGVIFFDPPLEYMEDPVGALKKPDQGIDRRTRAYPDGTNMKIKDAKRRHVRDLPKRNLNVRGVKNNRADHLVISDIEGHSARELCEHPNSLGPDFVHKREKVFCDMETADWWPLCDEDNTEGCFDLKDRAIKGFEPGSLAARSAKAKRIVPKNYSSHEEW
ncbi:hypothetical protein AJ79_07497 [Helicocarpus griseus UAMH5409]|uniref:Uncharacterized protein n=1 Tax=Helicocarpus griseus UAMH5409 TaxID=1447875 RepID=A0A2B7X293_9EURO|nr:hypothetical protein AJ79_07497 [Helicocarpus griseus UAMH5409]